VLNFAHGAMAMYVAFVYSDLRDRAGLGFAAAGLLALAVAALLGLLAHLLVFGPLRGAPPLSKVVASVGLMGTLQGVATLQFGSANRIVAPVLPADPVSLLGISVPGDRLLLTAIAVAAAAGLAALFRWTRFGLATRAAAEDETAAALLGYSPARLAAVNWVAASLLAGAGGILLAPITALNPVSYTLFVVPALAAAVVGRLSQFGVTTAAALALGMAQSEVVKLQADVPALRPVNLRDGLPFLVIVLVVVGRGRLVPERGGPTGSRLPLAGLPRRPGRALAAGGVVGALALAVSSGALRLGLIRSVIAAVICLSIVVLTGYVGQLSLAQLALAGVAGFGLSRLAQWHVPFPIAPLLAACAAAVVGLLVGLASRRVRGIDLAVVTLAAGVAVEELVFKNDLLTGGLGGSTVPPPRAGLDLAIGRAGSGYPRLAFGLLALVVLLAAAGAVAALRRGRSGRRMLAVRANERAAEAAGVDVVRTKLLAFVLAAFLAGLGGALLGYAQGQLSFDSFSVLASLSFLAVTYVGGVARISGALVGALLVPGGLLFTALDSVPAAYSLLLPSAALVVVAVLAPQGLMGLIGRRS
jgi:branched-chain amino acid transport system permease protein